MRRIALITLAIVLLGAAAGAISAAEGSSSYKFNVIFDDARGLIAGQEVKIAGADAGSISKVTVTSDYRAQVQASIPDRFRFRSNATCTIRPDGLIAENYLECDPGTSKQPLGTTSGGVPTVPVTQTTEPVTLQDLFDIFNVPTSERFQALINELGIATAGQGDNLNAILRRANPTLKLAQNVIDILDHQTAQISTAIDATDQIARSGSANTVAIKNFLTQAASLTALTANHSTSLEQTINRLPALLSAAQPALNQLNTVAVDGTPLLASLRRAAPYLDKVDNDIVPFTALAKPALAALSTTVGNAIPTAQKVLPLVKTLNNYIVDSAATTKTFSGLVTNLIQHGFSENLLSVFYYVASALSKYDSDSHMLAGLLTFPGGGACAMYATTPSSNPQCQGHYVLQGGATADRVPAKTQTTTTTTPTRTSTTAHATTPAAPATTTPTAPTTTTPASGLGTLGSTLGGTLNKVTSGLGLTGTTTTGSQTSTSPLGSLLSYLMGSQ